MNNTAVINSKKETAPFIVLCLAVAFAFLGWKYQFKGVPTHPPAPPKDKIIGTKAPDFTLTDLKGIKHRLSSYRGKVVLLNIWATWCQPCVDEMPSMQKLHEGLQGKDFVILASSIDAEVSLVEPFMQKYGLTFSALLDTDAKISKLYETTGVPESFIINKEGVVVEKIVGPIDWNVSGVFEFMEKLISAKYTQAKY